MRSERRKETSYTKSGGEKERDEGEKKKQVEEGFRGTGLEDKRKIKKEGQTRLIRTCCNEGKSRKQGG